MARSILKDWVMDLGLRHQGVLVAAVRGCDTAPRHDPSKLLSRALRGEFLVAHVGDASKAKTFIQLCSAEELADRMKAFLDNSDHYPMHYVMHFIHAAEVIAYHGPIDRREAWLAFYEKACRKLHVTPETAQEMDARLSADEETFFAAQDTAIDVTRNTKG